MSTGSTFLLSEETKRNRGGHTAIRCAERSEDSPRPGQRGRPRRGVVVEVDTGRSGSTHIATAVRHLACYDVPKGKAMIAVEQVTALLGGPKVLGRKLRTQLDFIPLLREGLPYSALEALTGKLELSIDVTSTCLQLARRTLARRKERDRLDAQESERIVRLADVAAHAAETLGGLDKARQWLVAENRALGGAAPITLLDTDVGTRAVEDVLIRIDHGVYS